MRLIFARFLQNAELEIFLGVWKIVHVILFTLNVSSHAVARQNFKQEAMFHPAINDVNAFDAISSRV